MVHESWRYMLPCGHHPYVVRPSNPPSKRYRCTTCNNYYGEGSLIDKKDQTAQSRGVASGRQ